MSNGKRLLDPEEEGITTFRNVGKNLPVDTAQYPRRLGSSTTPLRESEIKHGEDNWFFPGTRQKFRALLQNTEVSVRKSGQQGFSVYDDA